MLTESAIHVAKSATDWHNRGTSKNLMGTGTATGFNPIPRNVSVRAALIGLDKPTQGVMHDCFRQFGVEAVLVPLAEVDRLNAEKFEAGVLVLDENAAEVLQTIRKSPSNSRMVIYGVAANATEALKFSKFGINVVLDKPVDRQNAVRALRATHLLVLHELRRYVRVPLVAEVKVETSTQTFRGISCEVSSGGMSVHLRHKLPVPSDVQVSFELPGRGIVSVRSTVCWTRHSEELLGLRFHPSDERRLVVHSWTDEYLGIR